MVVARVVLPIGVLPSFCTPSPQGLLQMVSAFNDVSLFLMLSTQPGPDAEISSVSALGAYSYHTSSTNFLINALLWKLDSLDTRRTQPTTNPSPPYSPILHLAIPWVTDI